MLRLTAGIMGIAGNSITVGSKGGDLSAVAWGLFSNPIKPSRGRWCRGMGQRDRFGAQGAEPVTGPEPGSQAPPHV